MSNLVIYSEVLDSNWMYLLDILEIIHSVSSVKLIIFNLLYSLEVRKSYVRIF